MNKEREWLLRDKYGGAECEAFFQDLERLEAGEPLAYVIGWVPFLNTKIHLDSRPLIPRPETEYWTDIAIKEIGRSGLKDPKVLDLCAGSGAIGVAVLKALPGAQVDFGEIDETHHDTIRKNLSEAGIGGGRFRIFGGDLFEEVGEGYDFILTNPPYVETGSKTVEESVLEYEPHRALFGGEDGLEIIKRILNEAEAHLNPGGAIYMEHRPVQKEALSQHPLYQKSYPDQFGKVRFSVFKSNIDPAKN